MILWHSGTCACVIEEIFEEGVRIGFGVIEKQCDKHEGVSAKELGDVLLEEHSLVSNVVSRILVGHDELQDLGLHEEKLIQDENGTRFVKDFKEGVFPRWHYEGTGKERILKVSIELSKDKKDQVNELCDEKFGEGKAMLT